MFNLIDDVSAGIEGLAAVCGAHPAPPRHCAQIQRSDPVDAQGMFHREAPQRFRDDAVAFLYGQFLKSFVFKSSAFLAFVLIANPALETDVAARAQILKLAPGAFRVDGNLGKAEAHQPPAPGGRTTPA